MSEASLEVNTRYRNDLEEEKARLLKDLDRLKGKVLRANSASLWQHTLTHVSDTCCVNDYDANTLNCTESLFVGDRDCEITVVKIAEVMDALSL